MTSLKAWSLPSILTPALSGRDAVVDAIYRTVLGLDTNDVDLFKSALTKDCVFILNGKTTEGMDALVTDVFDKVAKLDTTHFVNNVRVNMDGAKASLSASALAQHYRGGMGTDPKAERLLAGALYFVELVKEDGDVEVWKIVNWRMQLTWAEGDMAIAM